VVLIDRPREFEAYWDRLEAKAESGDERDAPDRLGSRQTSQTRS
jgi:hypothetical protein